MLKYDRPPFVLRSRRERKTNQTKKRQFTNKIQSHVPIRPCVPIASQRLGCGICFPTPFFCIFARRRRSDGLIYRGWATFFFVRLVVGESNQHNLLPVILSAYVGLKHLTGENPVAGLSLLPFLSCFCVFVGSVQVGLRGFLEYDLGIPRD